MRIAIYGAGAVGGFLAARLARAGRDVRVVARGEHLKAIREKGLTLQMPDETFTVQLPASDDPSAIGPVDLVLVTLKTTANPAVARGIAPLMHDETRVAFAQNGVFWWYAHDFAPGVPVPVQWLDPDGALAAVVPPERALGMVIYSPNEVTAPGHVVCTKRESSFQLGGPAADQPSLSAVAEALGGAGFAVGLPADIRAEMWRKLFINLSSAPLCALTRSTMKDLAAEPGMEAVARMITEDGLKVAAAHGFTDLGIDPAALARPANRSGHRPSMLQDLELGRPMEIDSMLGAVQDFARAAEVSTPTLDIVLALLAMLGRSRGLYPPPA